MPFIRNRPFEISRCDAVNKRSDNYSLIRLIFVLQTHFYSIRNGDITRISSWNWEDSHDQFWATDKLEWASHFCSSCRFPFNFLIWNHWNHFSRSSPFKFIECRVQFLPFPPDVRMALLGAPLQARILNQFALQSLKPVFGHMLSFEEINARIDRLSGLQHNLCQMQTHYAWNQHFQTRRAEHLESAESKAFREDWKLVLALENSATIPTWIPIDQAARLQLIRMALA